MTLLLCVEISRIVGAQMGRGLGWLLHKAAYFGWQDIEPELQRIRVELGLLALGDAVEPLGFAENEELIESILRRLAQHYGLG